jgi:hypothetical protein
MSMHHPSFDDFSPAESSAGITPFAPSEWSLKIGLVSSSHLQSYCAEVMRYEQRMCRLCLACENMSEEDARKVLTDKARGMGCRVQVAPHTGSITVDVVSGMQARRAPSSERTIDRCR